MRFVLSVAFLFSVTSMAAPRFKVGDLVAIKDTPKFSVLKIEKRLPKGEYRLENDQWYSEKDLIALVTQFGNIKVGQEVLTEHQGLLTRPVERITETGFFQFKDDPLWYPSDRVSELIRELNGVRIGQAVFDLADKTVKPVVLITKKQNTPLFWIGSRWLKRENFETFVNEYGRFAAGTRVLETQDTLQYREIRRITENGSYFQLDDGHWYPNYFIKHMPNVDSVRYKRLGDEVFLFQRPYDKKKSCLNQKSLIKLFDCSWALIEKFETKSFLGWQETQTQDELLENWSLLLEEAPSLSKSIEVDTLKKLQLKSNEIWNRIVVLADRDNIRARKNYLNWSFSEDTQANKKLRLEIIQLKADTLSFMSSGGMGAIDINGRDLQSWKQRNLEAPRSIFLDQIILELHASIFVNSNGEPVGSLRDKMSVPELATLDASINNYWAWQSLSLFAGVHPDLLSWDSFLLGNDGIIAYSGTIFGPETISYANLKLEDKWTKSWRIRTHHLVNPKLIRDLERLWLRR